MPTLRVNHLHAIAHSRLATAPLEAPLLESAQRLSETQIGLVEQRGLVHLPLLDGDRRPIGVVNARDALRALVQAGEYEEALLRDYVMGIGYH